MERESHKIYLVAPRGSAALLSGGNFLILKKIPLVFGPLHLPDDLSCPFGSSTSDGVSVYVKVVGENLTAGSSLSCQI